MRLLVAALVSLALAGAAFAQAPRLRPEVAVAGDVVRFGDLVDNAGALADEPLFRAPQPGATGSIRTERILQAVAEIGADGLDTRGLPFVTVRRPQREATADELAGALRPALARIEPSIADARLTLDALARPLTLDALAKASLTVEAATIDLKQDRFEARMSAPGMAEPLRVTGVIDLRVGVVTLTRAIPRGEPIQPADMRIEQKKSAEAAGAITDPGKVSGLVARRALRPGQTIREADVVRPDIVEKNQVVTLHYESGGLSLALRGKALASGPEGASIPVQNLQSKRILEGVITGPGRVILKADRP